MCCPLQLRVVVSSESEAFVKWLRLLLAALADLALKQKRLEEVVAFQHSVSDKHLGARSCGSSCRVPSFSPRSGTAYTAVVCPAKPKAMLI